MPLILSLETATTMCSVALSKDGKCIALREINEGFSHSERLNVFVEELFIEADLNLKDIDAVAVSGGPGSYTGLRIGVSSAKGFCFALDKPLISISTLEAMAFGAFKLITEENFILCPMIDARRMEVYVQLFQPLINSDNNSSSLILKELSEIKSVIIAEEFLKNEYPGYQIIYFGDGAEKCSDILSDTRFVFQKGNFISSVNMISLAEEKLSRENFQDLAAFEPFYLKEFRALK